MEYYTTTHLQILFSVSHTAIQARAREFAEYLSPSATPPKGKPRRFDERDVRIMALIDDYHKRGYGWEDAHVALKSGQIGDLPLSSDTLTAMTPASIEERLQMELLVVRQQAEEYKSKYDQTFGKLEMAEKQLAEKERKIDELNRLIGQLQAAKDVKH